MYYDIDGHVVLVALIVCVVPRCRELTSVRPQNRNASAVQYRNRYRKGG
jgi:hypothetical protein